MRRRFLLVVLLTVGLIVASAPLAIATPESPEGDTVHVIVVFESAEERTPGVVEEVGGTFTGGQGIEVVPVLFAEVPRSAVSSLRRHPAVESVSLDRTVDVAAQEVPWGVDRINATEAAATIDASARSNVTVAVLDTGVDDDHEDLATDLRWGVNTTGPGPVRYGLETADDNHGHGTNVAGIVAAADNGIGVVGVAPSVGIYAVAVMNDSGTGTYSDLIEGLDAAVKGPDNETGTADDPEVVTMSLGGATDDPALERAIESASEHALLVAAAGNNGDGDPATDDVAFPAKYEEVIAVGATDSDDETPSWSAEGPAIEFVAPGVGTISTNRDDQYGRSSGTSMAAPHVAGTLALMAARDLEDGRRDETDAALRSRLASRAVDLASPGRDNETGHGLILADEAVRRSTVGLRLSANRTEVDEGDSIRFTVRRNDTDAGVRANITLDGTAIRTDGAGVATYRPDGVGNVTATATASGTTWLRFERASIGLSVRAPETAAIEIEDQETTGGSVTVRSISLPADGFAVVYADRNATADDVLGASSRLDPGTTDDVQITLDPPIGDDAMVWAVAHADDGDGSFNLSDDSPFRDDAGSDIGASANLTLVTAPSVAEYEDDSGTVQTAGLRRAIQDWALGNLPTDVLRDVIRSWAIGA